MAEQAARLGFIKSEIIKAERGRKKEGENRGSHQRGRDREIGVDFSQIDRLYLLFLGQRVPLSPAAPPPRCFPLRQRQTGNEKRADRILRSGGLGINCFI